MKTVAQWLVALGALLEVFGYWGMYTEAGTRTFDEMDGLIPFGAGLLGIGLLVLGGALWLAYRNR